MLKAKHEIELFTETGTLTGGTTAWAAKNFKSVVTVDVNKPLPWQEPNIHSAQSDSALFLERCPPTGPTLFWLDAHTNESCPVLREIAAINKSPFRHVILVDDSRLFGQLPDWPTAGQVIMELVDGGRRSIYIHEDVFVAEPCP